MGAKGGITSGGRAMARMQTVLGTMPVLNKELDIWHCQAPDSSELRRCY